VWYLSRRTTSKLDLHFLPLRMKLLTSRKVGGAEQMTLADFAGASLRKDLFNFTSIPLRSVTQASVDMISES
jgi:hypothetical protein